MKKYPPPSLLFVLVFFMICPYVSGQFQIPPVPKFQTSVYDEIGMLSPQEKNKLRDKLIGYSDSTSTQIVVAIIQSTEGEEISFLASEWAEAWKIGQAEKDNGIFILLAREDRRININNGYGVEHRLTDLTTKQIIDGVIIPEFKKGDYYAGLEKGTDAIFDALNGEFVALPQKEKESEIDWLFWLIICIPLLLVMSVFILGIWGALRGNKGGGYGSYGYGSSGSYSSSSSYSPSRSSSSYSSASSFSGGFGGGSFGGAGASGSW